MERALKTKNVHYRLDEETYGRLCDVAASMGVTHTEAISRAVKLLATVEEHKPAKVNGLLALAGIISDEEAEEMIKVYKDRQHPRNFTKILKI